MQSTEKEQINIPLQYIPKKTDCVIIFLYFPVSPAECHSVSPTPPNLCTGKEVICVLFSEMNTRFLDF